jgi:hypothetical protein
MTQFLLFRLDVILSVADFCLPCSQLHCASNPTFMWKQAYACAYCKWLLYKNCQQGLIFTLPLAMLLPPLAKTLYLIWFE